MDEKPTAGPERKVYRGLLDLAKRYRLKLKNNQKLLEHADQWYQCRVNPGSIELAYLELPKYIDPGRISNNIKPFDIAVGYPRSK